jgi:hypothetical protein
VIALVVTLLVACGGATPEPRPVAPQEPGCSITCDDVDLRDVLVTDPLGHFLVSYDARIRRLVLADVRRRDPRSVHFEPLDAALRPFAGVAVGPNGEVFASRLDANGAVESVVVQRGEPPMPLDVAGRLNEYGPRETTAEVRVDDGVVAARRCAPDCGDFVRVDDGTRDHEPAHRVGAGAVAIVTPTGIAVAHQDQTDGTVVVADVTLPAGDVHRTVVADPFRTRGLRIALGRDGVFDLAARVDGGRLRVEALRVR